ncbi:hypothetical protein I7I51_08332 [Histoplasma capsulatum]|uniref:Uncharacterized protein n=1 Tax=Ajellomyces capsulatus TaxID=5037 RepID=A0A8A1M389_AJECA|nr:hypothetical protein I7I51_08332 [Histoplasma capsulatum]
MIESLEILAGATALDLLGDGHNNDKFPAPIYVSRCNCQEARLIHRNVENFEQIRIVSGQQVSEARTITIPDMKQSANPVVNGQWSMVMQSSAVEAANTPGHANSSHSIRKVGASSFLSCNPLENYSFGPKIEESVGVLDKIVMFLGFRQWIPCR